MTGEEPSVRTFPRLRSPLLMAEKVAYHSRLVPLESKMRHKLQQEPFDPAIGPNQLEAILPALLTGGLVGENSPVRPLHVLQYRLVCVTQGNPRAILRTGPIAPPLANHQRTFSIEESGEILGRRCRVCHYR